MTAAIETITREWAIPHVGVRRIRASVFEGNWGSRRVFEKNGLEFIGEVFVKGGGVNGEDRVHWFLEWNQV
jgi:RimJ/RimL family protein N-acetyltransferase